MRSAIEAAQASHGISGQDIYELSTHGCLDALLRAESVLDLGCGAGNFGVFLREKNFTGRLDGMDLVRFGNFATKCYGDFFETDLNGAFETLTERRYDFVISHEVIHSMENHRAFVRSAARLLKPGGCFIATTANPLALPSLGTLLSRGVFRNFTDAPGRYPSQITPLLPVDARRIIVECGLEPVPVLFSNRSRWPGCDAAIQEWLPFLRGDFSPITTASGAGGAARDFLLPR